MKDMVSERLILLATSQEYMTNVADKLDQWDSSLQLMERSSFECINVSDKVFNMSREGKHLAEQLEGYYLNPPGGADEINKPERKLAEMKQLFQTIMEACTAGNDAAHKLDDETAYQKEIKEDVRKSLVGVREGIDSAVACAEFMLAEL